MDNNNDFKKDNSKEDTKYGLKTNSENYMTEGIMYGLIAGVVVSGIAEDAAISVGPAILIGLVGGALIGGVIKKKKK